MKKFIGYYIIGATTRKDAQDEKGLMLWSETKPSALKRFLNEKLLGVFWVDKDRVLVDKGKTAQSQSGPVNEEKPVTEMPRLQPVKETPADQPRKNTPRRTAKK